MSPNRFFEKRQSAWNDLKSHLTSEMPEVRLGAEVSYFEGMARYDGIERFCIEGTDLLLLEMPQGAWTGRMISTLTELNEKRGVTVLLAHIERYLKQQSKDTWKQLLHSGIIMQVSADYFIDRKTRRRALKQLKAGSVHLLGSDCHNMNTRPPNMAAAVSIINSVKKEDYLKNINRLENILLSDNKLLVK
jgi:protein-tyrosine phosphatase